MLKKAAAAVIALVLLASLFALQPADKVERTTIAFKGGAEISAEIADDEEGWEKGLASRSRVGANEGMLFIFDYDEYWAFWMKDMLFPLDIIWLNMEKKIVHIQRNAQPCQEGCDSYVPLVPAKYVIEVNAGFAAKHNLAVGDSVSFKMIEI